MFLTHMRRAPVLLICTATLATVVAGSATAQADDHATLEGMRGCATIADQALRATCYDGYLRPRAPAKRMAPPAPLQAQALPPPVAASRGASARPRERTYRYTGSVATAVERERGVYLLTMRDGRQWLFASSVRPSYDPPMPGSRIEIQPGALGSLLLSYNGQSAVRVIAVR